MPLPQHGGGKRRDGSEDTVVTDLDATQHGHAAAAGTDVSTSPTAAGTAAANSDLRTTPPAAVTAAPATEAAAGTGADQTAAAQGFVPGRVRSLVVDVDTLETQRGFAPAHFGTSPAEPTPREPRNDAEATSPPSDSEPNYASAFAGVPFRGRKAVRPSQKIVARLRQNAGASQSPFLRSVQEAFAEEEQTEDPVLDVVRTSTMEASHPIGVQDMLGRISESAVTQTNVVHQELLGKQLSMGQKRSSQAHLAAVLTIANSPELAETSQGTALDDYVLKVFGNDRKAHALAVQQVDSFKQPLARTKLVVQIVSGSNLYPKDITGASDPFVVLELRDRRRLRYHRPRVQKRALPEHHFESSVKEQTLNPSWNEECVFEYDPAACSTLCVSVWDRDNEMLDVRRGVSGVSGLCRGCIEVCKMCSSKEDDEFLGKFEIDLDQIDLRPTSRTVELQGRSRRSHVSGVVTLKLRKQTHEHRPPRGWGTTNPETSPAWPSLVIHMDIIMACIRHDEAHIFGTNGQSWDGKLSDSALLLINEHARQLRFTPAQQAFAFWRSYATTHTQLDSISYFALMQRFQTLAEILREDRRALRPDQAIDDLQATNEAFLECLLRLLSRLFEAFGQSPEGVDSLMLVLTLIKDVFVMSTPFQLNEKEFDTGLSELCLRSLQESVVQRFATSRSQPTTPQEYDGRDIVQAVKSVVAAQDTLVAVHNFYREPIRQVTGLDLYKVALTELDKLLALEIEGTCQVWQRKPSIPTTVFRLYFAVERLVRTELSASVDLEADTLKLLKNYHSFFEPLVKRWISQLEMQTMLWVQKSVDVDAPVMLAEGLAYSSSVVDVFSCLAQVWEFWDKLEWPEGSFETEMTGHVVQVITSSILNYTITVIEELRENRFFSNDDDSGFQVTAPLCVALNNFEAIERELRSMSQLPRVDAAQQRYQRSFRFSQSTPLCLTRRLLDETASNVRHSMQSVLNVVGTKVCKYGGSLLEALVYHPLVTDKTDGTITAKQLEELTGPMLDYINKGLVDFSNSLVPHLFDRLLQIIWEQVLEQFRGLLVPPTDVHGPLTERQKDLVVRFSVSLFDFFYQDGQGLPREQLQSTVWQEVHRIMVWATDLSTYDLMCVCLHEEAAVDPSHQQVVTGHLTVAVQADSQRSLQITVVDGELLPRDGKAFDSYVKLRLFPVPRGMVRHRTKTQKRTLKPSWNEHFVIPTREGLELKDMVLQIACYEDHFFRDVLIGESLILLSDLPVALAKRPLRHGHHTKGPAWEAYRLLERRAKGGRDELAAKFIHDRQHSR
eukprot:m.331930 g.331930  ORF g.331930 m.331930 type:complete len:1291 (-) comp19773_c0_seq11:5477-9349(-)